jgi:8-oxo-dGTP pyrophosphatase MutT (NUDIX family)
VAQGVDAVTAHAPAAATASVAGARVPFRLDGCEVGSVARVHLPLLAEQPDLIELRDDAVAWIGAAERRDADFDRLHRRWRSQGHIRAWRDETYAIVDPATLRELARIERAASRFWGTLTFGAHATGYVAGIDGRAEKIWIAQRSFSKSTDPGLFDNLIGGGVPQGQTAAEALVREGFEEAGLRPAQLAGMKAAGVLRLARDIPEGFQHEWIHAFDVELPAGLQPQNQDGEVAGFSLMPAAEAMALASGTAMTVDSALVTLDFGLRHGLIVDAELDACLRHLRVHPRF